MANRERRKGLEGEREVAAIWRRFEHVVRGLDGSGDFLVVVRGRATLLHVESKRQNRLRTAWIEQAEREAPDGAVPVVPWRPDGGRWHPTRWWAMIPLEDLARLLA